MKFNKLKDHLDELAEELLSSATETHADVFGLDYRCAHSLWLTEEQDAIAVSKADDRTFRHYGGFNDVDSDHRLELGDYVLYSADDPRVAEHIAIAIDAMDDEEPTPEDIAASKADQSNDALKCEEI